MKTLALLDALVCAVDVAVVDAVDDVVETSETGTQCASLRVMSTNAEKWMAGEAVFAGERAR